MQTLQQRIDSLRALESAAWRTLETEGAVPGGRLWHTLTPLGDGSRRLCMFGGVSPVEGMMDDTWLLELPTAPDQPARWQQVQARGRLPQGRAHHDAVVVQGRWLIIHGGLLENGCRWDDTWRLDLTSAAPEWQQLGEEGSKRPTPRYHHSLAATEDGKIILFGGHDYQRVALDDAWILDAGGAPGDPAELRWRQVGGAFRPQPRAYHAAVVAGDWMLILGGELQDRRSDTGIWALDLRKEVWHQLQSEREESEFEPSLLGGHGLMRHAACSLGAAGAVAVSGGQGQSLHEEPGPIDCTVFWLEADGEASGKASGKSGAERSAAGASYRIRFEQRDEGATASLPDEAPFRPRRDAALLRLPSGHLVLFGGNDGSAVDAFGDGFHQCGCEETLVADAAGLAASGLGEWHVASQGAPEATFLGCAVAVSPDTSEVVVADAKSEGGRLRVHALALR